MEGDLIRKRIVIAAGVPLCAGFFFTLPVMQAVQLLRQHGAFLLLFVFAAVLRLAPLKEYQFTYDEISALQRVGFSSFSGLIEKGIRIDAHPALVQTIIYFIVKWFGVTTWIIKLPFLLLNIASLPYVYLFCKRNFNAAAAFNATVIFGFSIICMYYAPIARMYGCGIFFSAGLLFHFYELLFRRGRQSLHYCCFTAFMLAGALNHHMNALFAATVYLSGLFLIARQQRSGYIASGIAATVLYAPHLPVTLYQLSVGGIGVSQGGWLEPPAITAFPELLNVLCGAGYGLLVILALSVMARLPGKPAARRFSWLLPALFIVNFLIIYLYSLFRAPIYQHSLMVFSGTGLLLFVSGVLTGRSAVMNQVISGLLFLWFLWSTFVQKDLYRQTVKTVYEYQFERTAELKKKHGARIFPVFFETDSVMRTIYTAKYGSYALLLENSPALASPETFSQFTDTTSAAYIAVASSQPLYQSFIRDRFPYLIEKDVTQAIHYKVYSRLKEDAARAVPDDSLRLFTRHSVPAVFDFPEVVGKQVEQEDEYPLHISARYDDVAKEEGEIVLAEAAVSSRSLLSGLECCIAVTGDNGEVKHYNAGRIVQRRLNNRDTCVLRAQLFIGNLHRKARQTDRINIYLWNRSRERFFLHELTVKVIRHWPEKWHFWD